MLGETHTEQLYYNLRKLIYDKRYPEDKDNASFWHYWKFNIWDEVYTKEFKDLTIEEIKEVLLK